MEFCTSITMSESQFSVTEINIVLLELKDKERGRKIKPENSNSILKIHKIYCCERL